MIGLLAACVSVGPPPDSGLAAGWPVPLLVSPAVTGVQWVDARSAEDYAAGHLPGAANVSPADFPPLDADGAWPEAQLSVIPPTFANRGVAADVPIVVYGDPLTAGADDGAIYWVLRYLGRTDVQILDGGVVSWLAAGGTLDADIPPPGDFVGAADPSLFATTPEVEAAVAAGTPTVVDVRTTSEFDSGHIPGAIHLPWDAVLEDGSYRSPEAVAGVLADLPEGPLVLSCSRGIRAGHAFFTLELMGRTGLSDYVASWEGWSAAGLPVE